jgi:putative tryptophan/tyrosine transport system substrate-binding protein
LRVDVVGVQPRTTAIYVAFLQRMAELGYEEGKNFVFDYAQVPNIEGYERGYQELAARNVDIFFASGPEIALKSALAAAGTHPIVMIGERQPT